MQTFEKTVQKSKSGYIAPSRLTSPGLHPCMDTSLDRKFIPDGQALHKKEPIDSSRCRLAGAKSSGLEHSFGLIPVYPFSNRTMQTKLLINDPEDAYEQEANRMSDGAVRITDSKKTQGRHLADHNHSPKRAGIKNGWPRKICQTAAPDNLFCNAASGHALSAEMKASLEPYFDRDFSLVKIHADAGAAKAAEMIHAKAFTINHQIWFGQSQYNPTSQEGMKLIAHELSHVILQQETGLRKIQRSPADSDVTGPCPDIQVAHMLLRQGDIHPSVREAQRKLNVFDEKSKRTGYRGLPDGLLVEDCVFGPKTHEAVVAFQQQFFPLSPEEWDGLIGPKTWAGLDMTDATSEFTPMCPVENAAVSTGASPSDYPALSSYTPCGQQPESPAMPGETIDDAAHHCRMAIDMNKIVHGTFEGGYRMEDYYPEHAGKEQWQHGDTAGPWVVLGPANQCRAGVNVQLIGRIAGHCDSGNFRLEQYVTYTRYRESDFPHFKEGVRELDGAQYDFGRPPKRQTWLSYLPNGYSMIHISMADPPSFPFIVQGIPGVATPTKKLDTLRNFESSLVGPNGKKTIFWSHELIVKDGILIKNDVR